MLLLGSLTVWVTIICMSKGDSKTAASLESFPQHEWILTKAATLELSAQCKGSSTGLGDLSAPELVRLAFPEALLCFSKTGRGPPRIWVTCPSCVKLFICRVCWASLCLSEETTRQQSPTWLFLTSLQPFSSPHPTAHRTFCSVCPKNPSLVSRLSLLSTQPLPCPSSSWH